MIYHCKAVAVGAPNTFRVGDMPFGSYEISDSNAIQNAIRVIKEVFIIIYTITYFLKGSSTCHQT